MILLRKTHTATKIGRTVSGLDKLLDSDPTFPKPIKLGNHRQSPVYFDESELNAWIDAKKAQRMEVNHVGA